MSPLPINPFAPTILLTFTSRILPQAIMSLVETPVFAGGLDAKQFEAEMPEGVDVGVTGTSPSQHAELVVAASHEDVTASNPYEGPLPAKVMVARTPVYSQSDEGCLEPQVSMLRFSPGTETQGLRILSSRLRNMFTPQLIFSWKALA